MPRPRSLRTRWLDQHLETLHFDAYPYLDPSFLGPGCVITWAVANLG